MGRTLAPPRCHALPGSTGPLITGDVVPGSEDQMTEYEPPLVSLPGTRLSPEVLLHRTLNKVGRMKAVTVIIQWDDDTFDCDWSSMKTSELCMAEKVFDEEVRKALCR